ncbi:hypothetical protein [Nonomuraea sp. NPDC046570]|uniref:hypothetical protein n=1 Tax=Nonomuraea sp. NPDC046570 TaxID=3155255 RepID=UPI0033D6B940
MRDVVRAVIAEVAPEELPIVDGLRQFDDETAVARLAGRGTARDPLGFGLEEIVYIATPVVWVALDESMRRVVGQAVDDLRVPRGARRLLRRVFRRRAAPLVVPALTAEQVADVRRRILELSEKSGLEPERAETLADRVATHLLLPPDPADDSRALRSCSASSRRH